MADHRELQQAWSETLDRYGSVEFHRSKRKVLPLVLIAFVFVAIGVVLAVTGQGGDFAIGAACTAVAGLCFAVFAAQLFQHGPILRADRTGLHLPRRTPLDIGWEQVVDVATYKANRLAAAQLLVRVSPDLYAAYLAKMPGGQRALFRLGQRSSRRDCVVVQLLDVPEVSLAAWIDEEADRLAPAPRSLVLLPATEVSPLWSAVTLRPVALHKLRLPAELEAALLDFGERATPVVLEIENGGSPGATWGYLAGEGRQLCARVEVALGAGASVVWFEDGPRPQEAYSTF